MTKKSPRQRMTQRALSVFVLMVVLGFGASIFSLVRIQLVQNEKYRRKAEGNQLQSTLLPAQRGVIYDAKKEVLAKSANVWKVYLNPSRFPNDSVREEVCKELSQMLELDYDALMAKAKRSDLKYLDIKRRIELEKRDEVAGYMDKKITYQVEVYNKKTKAKELQDRTIRVRVMVGLDVDIKRYYPLGDFASTIIGFSGEDDIGLDGLEKRYNDVLRGVPGRRITAENGRGYVMDVQYETLYDAKQGTSLMLTIDESIQRFLEKELEQVHIDTQSKAVYGIVMDVKTGAVLGMAGMPNYDLNSPREIQDPAVQAQLDAIEDPDEKSEARKNAQYAMWRNRGVSDIYDPGSVFKIVTAAAALEEGTFPLDGTYTCKYSIKVRDRVYRCHRAGGHGHETFTQGMMNSCNPFFITVAQSLGVEKFYDYFEAFGFTEKTGIDLPAEFQPKAGVTYHKKEDMTEVNLASMSFGQSFQVSPIQIINMVACIGNGGKLMRPYIVAKELDEKGGTVRETQPTVIRQAVSEATAKQVAEMLRMVVAQGTGKNAYVPGFNVAGKTGTSEKLGKDGKLEGKYVTSFAGFAPAEDARIALLITIDEPVGDHGGGLVAAPVAARVMEASLNYLNAEPHYTPEEMEMLRLKTPGVAGKSVAAAKTQLDAAKLSVKVVGEGKEVVSQIPAEGKNISKGGVVILYTQKDAKAQLTQMPDFTNLSITQAMNLASARGLNLKISGNTLKSGELRAYRQSEPLGKELELGSDVTVYFKSSMGVTDYGE